MTTSLFTYSHIRSADGTSIGYQQGGSGRRLIIVPGVLSTSADYTKIAGLLPASLTVYIIGRRGRGGRGPQGGAYSIRNECEDVKALQDATGAPYIFGHSFGGLEAPATIATAILGFLPA